MTQQSALKQDGKIIVHVDPDIADLIPGFLENRHKDIKTMGEALAQGDFDAIRLLGHSMKGAGGSYGFDAITDIGKSLEQAAIAKNFAEIQSLVKELSAYLDRVEVVYE
ncbi:MAG: phosphotransferase [Deltaproteobacteria bacterium RBG_13_52_11]|nr:MAG: phosphotransferase [Deltaproteobacteria bacterium RBG_13_52_11]